ncbi:hypothetical protein ASPWEDRAFT_170695 [Aspergillus wentii DTO 134E9]|uniref:Uncharacterized protein n=1 Tax=Aspergillus wentii DTO 134E9 TaxID=1073089 RepID=A0A1L9RQH6_ASPWE|nr:uncharacterized protein ASPWEDRAFT_170695 [Aspergillus wentii DTO 134E9]KAI9928305.1 hypothetical protein MW887_002338 [Aspergillus wentii]OJJ37210.1 hypothetical protein ASPWEDRAFT_170695 [Aspergillus wentii DTO 134E9]
MQRLWSRAARPQANCHCVSCVNPGAGAVSSRATTAASKRRLRIGNSVTALYTSIFAAAALADAKAKNRRRNEWEEKIAAVREEVNVLADEEKRLLTAIASRRRQRLSNGFSQTRQYSTTPALYRSRRFDKENRNGLSPSLNAAVEKHHEAENNPEVLEKICNEMGSPFDDDEHGESPLAMELKNTDDWAYPHDFLRLKAVRKLALRQLSLRLLLRPALAHGYLGHHVNYKPDYKVPQMNVTETLAELERIRRRIRDIKRSKDQPFEDLVQGLRTHFVPHLWKEQHKLDDELERDTELFLQEEMSLQEYLLRLASNLMQGTDPDRPRAVRIMLMAFAKSRQNDLGELVLRTLLPHKFLLTSSTIVTVLSFYRKTKNLKDFDLFLQMLTGTAGYPIDLGNLEFYERKVVNGIEIVTPPLDSANPVIYANLITAALRFNQPGRADAWHSAARKAGFMDDFSTLFAYLRFYGIQKDWEKGLFTLRRALAYLVSSTDLEEHLVERMITLMVLLCDSCYRSDLAKCLIDAAVASGFPRDLPKKQRDITWPVDPHFQRWREAAGPSVPEIEEKPQGEKCHSFASIIGDQLMYEDLSTSQRHKNMLRWHSQHLLAATLAQQHMSHDVASEQTPEVSSKIYVEPEFSKSSSNDYIELAELAEPTENERTETQTKAPTASNAQNEEVLALKDEVSQLREMVFELRKAQIKQEQANREAREEAAFGSFQSPMDGRRPFLGPLPGQTKSFHHQASPSHPGETGTSSSIPVSKKGQRSARSNSKKAQDSETHWKLQWTKS